MKREEATSLLKEIIEVCNGINEQAVMLMPPNADGVLSHGYQLHIKMPTSNNLTCIRPIVQKHNLALAEETAKDLLVIYRPLKKENQLFEHETTNSN